MNNNTTSGDKMEPGDAGAIGTQYVKWKDNVKLIITVFCIAVAISLGAINLHSQAPHKDAVNKREFDRLTQSVDNGFARINDKLDRLVEQLPNK